MADGPQRCAAWRVLDAQHFGVAQRRARIFVLARGHSGAAWAAPDALLPITEGVQWHPAPSRQAWENVAGTLTARTKGGGGLGTDFECTGGLVEAYGGNNQSGDIGVATAVRAKGGTGHGDFESETFIVGEVAGCLTGADLAHTLRGDGFDATEDGTGRGTPLVPMTYRVTGNDGAYETEDHVGALGTGTDPTSTVLVFGETQITSANNRCNPQPGDPSHPLAASARPPTAAIANPDVALMVRRLTPLECERLQGFPDDYTLIPYRGGMAADGPRYRAIGNSMAVPVMAYLADRIEAVELHLRQCPTQPEGCAA